MIYVKLQSACLLLILFIIVIYLYYSLKAKVTCNKFFDCLMWIAPWAVVFDGITAITVNYLDIVPLWLNLIFHGLFYLFVDFVVIVSYAYMMDKTSGIPKKNLKKILVFLPAILSVILIVAFLPHTYFLTGNNTNYSMGPSVYICFSSVVVHYACIFGLTLVKRKNLKKEKLVLILFFLCTCFSILIIQIVFPELLVSSLFPLFTLLTFYIVNEDPAIRRVRMHNAEMVTGFATLVENRDNNTGGHIIRTQQYVRVILNEMKKTQAYSDVLTQDYILNVINAAPMHDIGKISTPDSILQKPGKLTDEEYAIMKLHAPKGGDIIQKTFANIGDSDFLKISYEVARFHHEKWNGRGYPDGLKETDIPLHARIMAIADVFDAVSAKRCYRDAMPLETCFKIIEEGSGKDFDPELVILFLGAKEIVMDFYAMSVE